MREAWKELGINYDEVFEKIKDILIKVCISAENSMLSPVNKISDHKNNCYELYGFDVLLDHALKPYVIECNVCPSLSSGSPLDKRIKNRLLSDSLNLVGFQPFDKKILKVDQNKKFIQDFKL